MSEEEQRSKDGGLKPVETGFASFWAELKRRKVMRVVGVYAVVAWLIIQVASATFGGFGIPEWAFRFVVLMLVVFFPVAIVLAWAFEMTPDGIKTTKHAREERGGVAASPVEQSKRAWTAVVFAAALPTLIFGALAVFFFFRSSPQDSSPASPGLVGFDKSIAVLPLQNLSPDPKNAFFAGGVHEDILTNLSRIKELKVISRTSTLQYADAKRNLSEIGAELGVRYVVEGSVRRAGDQVRVTVQLIDAQTDEHLWAENYDRELRDVFAIQSDVAKQIASTVHATISPEESARLDETPTENLLAYDYYVKARELVGTLEGVQRSREFYQKALELDPNFIEAHVGMGWYYFYMTIHNYLPSQEGLSKAEEWLKSAVALAPGDQAAFGHLSGAINLWHRWDWESAIKDHELAIERERDSLAIIGLGFCYVAVGNYEKAVELGKEAVELDPLNLIEKLYLAEFHGFAGNYDETVELCLSVLDSDSYGSMAYRVLARTYLWMGKLDEATEIAEKVVGMQQGKSWSRWSLAQCYIAAGRTNEALEILDAMLNDERDVYIPKLTVASLYSLLGNNDEAFEWLEKSYEAREYWLPASIKLKRDYGEAFLADPRFQDFVDRMNFPE